LYGQAGQLERVENHVRRLKELYIVYPELKKFLVLSLSYAAIAYYKAENKLKADDLILEMFHIYEDCLDESVAYYVSRAIAYALTRYGKEANASMVAECLSRLRKLDKAYPKTGPDEKLLYALSYLSGFYGDEGDFDKAEGCVAEAKDLYNARPSLDMGRELCHCLVNAIISYEKAESANKIDECVKELKALYRLHGDKNIVITCSYGIYRALIFMGRSDKQGLMYDYLTELKSLHEAFPDDKITGYYARGLSNAGIIYSRIGWYNNMSECMASLKKIYEEHPDPIVRKELAICLFNTRSICLKSWHENYENLALLHKLRFDIPGANRHDKIKLIENLYLEETQKMSLKQSKPCAPGEVTQALMEPSDKT
jgi:tetratricopeptide (TPR) repeat protein